MYGYFIYEEAGLMLNYDTALNEIAKLDKPNILLPLADAGAVNYLLKFFKPRALICYNRDRKKLMEIDNGCYKLPADFLRADSRVSLISGAVDLVFLNALPPSYWYISYNYVVKGGYMVGSVMNPDTRFDRWARAVNFENGVLIVN